jgi:ribonuclease E
MTVIDVNTGKFTGTGGNLESTVTSNNLEAAEEIVRQLRLRDIGGIIVIDFIDMVLPSNRELLLRRLVECLGRDRTRHQVAEITSLGLVQMTRKRIGTGLLEAFTTECPQCHGRGYELHDMPVPSQRHSDGGARESRPRAPRANAQVGPEKSTGETDPADITTVEVASERPAVRSRRGGGRSRSGAANREHDAAEPQDQPAGVS